MTGCGNFGLVGYGCGRIDKFNMQSGAHRGTFWAQPPIGHAGGIHGVEVTALNEIVVSASFDGSVKLWDFEERRLLHTFETASPVTQMQLNRDNSLLAVCCDDLKVRVYDVSSRRLVREFEGHTNRITDVCLSSDGRWALTASADRSLRIYDIPTARLIDWVCDRLQTGVGAPLACLYLSALLLLPLATPLAPCRPSSYLLQSPVINPCGPRRTRSSCDRMYVPSGALRQSCDGSGHVAFG